MVLGINEGSINIIIPKAAFSPGQKISGKIQLHLPNPTPARGLRVEFYGELKIGNKLTRGFEVSELLTDKESYNDKEEFDFALLIPQDIFNKQPKDALGRFLDVFNTKYYDWYVSATLDRQKKFDVTNRLKVDLELPAGALGAIR